MEGRYPNSMAVAAMISGIVSIISCFIFPVALPVITAGLSILFAVLSTGAERRMAMQAKIGIVTAVLGLVLNVVMISTTLVLIFTSPEIRAELNSISEQLYGESFDEMLEELEEVK